MKNRTRRRWLRRLAIGISFATFAAPAAARPGEYGASGNGAGSQPAASVRPDDRADRFTGLQQTELAGNAVRPDDRADRFVSSDGVSPATASDIDSSVSWDGAVTLGIGTLVLALALGFGLGYIRRPRIAGL
jgi:hypothetical protein